MTRFFELIAALFALNAVAKRPRLLLWVVGVAAGLMLIPLFATPIIQEFISRPVWDVIGQGLATLLVIIPIALLIERITR